MARLQFNCEASRDDTFVPDQLFVFGNIILHADSIGHLAQIGNFALNQVVTFGSLHYTTYPCGKLVLSGWTLSQIESCPPPRA